MFWSASDIGEFKEMRGTTQQALISLATISGAVIIGAIATQFYPGRWKRSASAAFSEAVIVAIIIAAAAATAATAVISLAEGEQVSSEVLWHIASPLALSVGLLTVLTMAARISPLTRSPWLLVLVVSTVVYLGAVGGLVIGIELANASTWLVIGVMAAAGTIIALAIWCFEPAIVFSSARKARMKLATRWQQGLNIEERPLKIGVPGLAASKLQILCWADGGRVYIDEPTARHLQRRIDERWQSVERGQAILPRSGELVIGVRVRVPMMPPWPTRLEILVHGRDPDRVSVDLEGSFFDVTGYDLV